MDVETRSATDALRADIRDVDGLLSAELRRLRQEVRDEGMTTRRHFDVVAESVRDDIRIIAEGLIALDSKVEAMKRS